MSLQITLQLEAEEKAAVSAKEGLSKKAREAEQRADLLQDQVTELEMSLERQRTAADTRYMAIYCRVKKVEALQFWSQNGRPQATGSDAHILSHHNPKD